MKPKSIHRGKKYLVDFKGRERAMKLRYKSTYFVSGRGPYYYFIFCSLDGKEQVYVKTHKRVLQALDDSYGEQEC